MNSNNLDHRPSQHFWQRLGSSSLLLGAFALFVSSQADARTPSYSEIAKVKELGIQLEVDANEAYFLSRDHSASGQLEDEALGDLFEFKNAAYEFSEAVTRYYSNPSMTANAFAILNGAFVQSRDSFNYLTSYNIYQALFENIVANMMSIRWYYLSYTSSYPYVVRVWYPRGYSYWYPYWRYHNHYHYLHLHTGYYQTPWTRHSYYRDIRHRYDHRYRDGYSDHHARHGRWWNDNQRRHGTSPRYGNDRTHRPSPGYRGGSSGRRGGHYTRPGSGHRTSPGTRPGSGSRAGNGHGRSDGGNRAGSGGHGRSDGGSRAGSGSQRGGRDSGDRGSAGRSNPRRDSGSRAGSGGSGRSRGDSGSARSGGSSGRSGSAGSGGGGGRSRGGDSGAGRGERKRGRG